MVEPSLRRPTAVTVIGWIFIAGAVFSLLASSLGLVTFANLYQMRKLLSRREMARTPPSCGS